MARINLDNDELLNLFTDRLATVWNVDPHSTEMGLYESMWERLINDGCFDGDYAFTISEIVDNDWVNNYRTIFKGESDWDDCMTAYNNNEWETESGITIAESCLDEDFDRAFLVYTH